MVEASEAGKVCQIRNGVYVCAWEKENIFIYDTSTIHWVREREKAGEEKEDRETCREF